jgi:protocatechuate 3,4-dioxygenase beta subunit
MRATLAVAVTCAVLAAAPGMAHLALSRQQSAPGTEPGLILGRVVDGTTGQPVSSAAVRLTPVGASPRDGVLTGADGQFVFSRVPPGAFALTVEKPGYFEGAYGKKRPLGDGIPLSLTNGERRSDVTVVVWPWASIAGTVVDDGDRPAAGVVVQAERRVAPGSTTSTFGGSATTDARGAYRIQHVAPGDYVVGAVCRSVHAPIPAVVGRVLPGAVGAPGGQPGETVFVDATGGSFLTVFGAVRTPRDSNERPMAYVTSYYGGATTASQAAVLRMAVGQDRADVDFALTARASVRVSGIVVGPKGPVPQAVIHLRPSDGDPLNTGVLAEDAASAVTSSDGSFTLPAVPVGSYLLDAERPHTAPYVNVTPTGLPRLSDPVMSSRDPEGYWSRQLLSVGERDVEDLIVTMLAGVKVSGATVFEHPMRPSDGRSMAPFIVILDHAGDSPPTAFVQSSNTATFTIAGVRPGWYVIRMQGLVDGWSVSSATLGGEDITGTPFEIGTADLAGLLLTISDRATSLKGAVTDSEGKPAADATIVLFPTDSTKWNTPVGSARHVQAVRATRGVFAIGGFPPGEYFLAAIDDGVMDDWPSQDLLRRISLGAIRVQVSAGEQQVQALRLKAVAR